MTLAAAGELEMGSAATYVGNALNTFGLRAKDAGAVAAALAGGANASSASCSRWSGPPQARPLARTAGVSLQTTVGILSAFDNAGIKGSNGSHVVQDDALPASSRPLDPAASAMREVAGLHRRALGTSCPCGTSLSSSASSQGSSQEQRPQALTTISGSDATRAATVLFSSARPVWKRHEGHVRPGRRAADGQRADEGRVRGWEAFKGSVETLAISLGIRLLPMFTRVVEGITSIVNAIAVHAGPTLDRFGKWFTASGTPALASFGAVIRYWFSAGVSSRCG